MRLCICGIRASTTQLAELEQDPQFVMGYFAGQVDEAIDCLAAEGVFIWEDLGKL